MTFFRRNQQQILLNITPTKNDTCSDEHSISGPQSELSNATAIREPLSDHTFEEPNCNEPPSFSQSSSIDISVIREKTHFALASHSTEASTSKCETKYSQMSETSGKHDVLPSSCQRSLGLLPRFV